MKKIRMFCDLNYGTGYNNAARGLVQCLEALGYNPSSLHLVGAVTSTYYAEFETADWLRPYVYGEWEGDEDVNLVLLNPGMVGDYHTSIGGRYNIAYCAWETNALPQAVFTINGVERTVVGDLNRYDEIWVPTSHVKKVFLNSGVMKPIHVVPHALQRCWLNTPPRREGGPITRFYSIGSWNARKNVEGLLQLWFASGFHVESKVNLVVHCVPSTRDMQAVRAASFIAQEGAKNLYMSANTPDALPPFGLLCTPKPFADIINLHRSNHVFVTVSRGEGFCLPVVEALAMGNHVIASGPWLDDLVENLGEGLAPTMIFRPSTDLVPITPMPECRGYELDQEWWEPNRHDFLDVLRKWAMSDALHPDFVAHVRQCYSPQRIADTAIRPRLEAVGAL